MAGDEGMPGSAAAALGLVLCAPGFTVVVLASIGCVAVVDCVGLCIGSAAPEGLVIDDAGVPERSAGWLGGSVCASGVALGVPVGGVGVCAGCVLAPVVAPICDAGVPERLAGWPGVSVCAAGEDALEPLGVGVGVGVLCASA